MKKLQVHTTTYFDIDELVEMLIDQYSEDDILEIISNIDSEIADIKFTERLKDYFDEEYMRESVIIMEEQAFEKAESSQEN